MIDSFAKSLIRGRMLATVAGVSAASVSGISAATDSLNEATALLTAALAFVSAIAALYSKLRELRQPKSVTQAYYGDVPMRESLLDDAELETMASIMHGPDVNYGPAVREVIKAQRRNLPGGPYFGDSGMRDDILSDTEVRELLHGKE